MKEIYRRLSRPKKPLCLAFGWNPIGADKVQCPSYASTTIHFFFVHSQILDHFVPNITPLSSFHIHLSHARHLQSILHRPDRVWPSLVVVLQVLHIASQDIANKTARPMLRINTLLFHHSRCLVRVGSGCCIPLLPLLSTSARSIRCVRPA